MITRRANLGWISERFKYNSLSLGQDLATGCLSSIVTKINLPYLKTSLSVSYNNNQY